MTTWQIMNVCNWGHEDHHGYDLLMSVAQERPEWRQIGQMISNQWKWDGVLGRDPYPPERSKELPEEFVRTVLGRFARKYYLENGNRLQGWFRRSESDQEMTALEAYDRYGPLALARASENGADVAPNENP